MAVHSRLLRWGSRLGSGVPLFGRQMRRSACRKLAAVKTAQAVPFLVSALAGRDEEVKRAAEEALTSLDDPAAIDALILGFSFTRDETVRRIIELLGRDVPESAGLSMTRPSAAEEAWRFRNNRDGTVLAFVPEGDFMAGEDGFRVHLPPYYLALTCVTNAQYASFLTHRRPGPGRLAAWIGLGPSAAIHKTGSSYAADPEKADLPVVWVTWEGARAYCKWAGLRLPTELEWEKGARGVDGRQYPWGDEWEEGRPRPPDGEPEGEAVTSVWAYPSARSPYGIYQMIGNVYEWCADWYEEGAYERHARGDITPAAGGENRVMRGGPWRFGTPAYLRTEYRKGTVWRGGTVLCGFRCARDL